MAKPGTFQKGKNGGPGRPPGTPNKSTKAAREAIARFVDGNADKLSQWLDEIYEADGPKAAFQCFADVIEFHVPKLARSEVTADVTVKNLYQEITELNAKRDPAGNK